MSTKARVSKQKIITLANETISRIHKAREEKKKALYMERNSPGLISRLIDRLLGLPPIDLTFYRLRSDVVDDWFETLDIFDKMPIVCYASNQEEKALSLLNLAKNIDDKEFVDITDEDLYTIS